VSFTYLDGEETIIIHLLQNLNVDEITSKCEEDFFSDLFLKNMYKICFDYSIGTGKGTVDFNAVCQIVRSMGKTDDHINYLSELYGEDVLSKPSITYVLEQLLLLSKRRKLIFNLQNQLIRASNPTNDVDAVLSETEETISNIDVKNKSLEVVLPRNLLERRYKGLEERYNTTGIYTGWEDFDKHLSVGFAPTKVSVVAGRTAMGKSFFKTNIIINMCRNGVGVLNVCPEQGFDSEHDRIDSIMTGRHLKSIIKIQGVKEDDEIWALLKHNSEKISREWNYACCPSRSITTSGVRSAIKRAKRAGVPINIVFIDLFDRLEDVNVVSERTSTFSSKLGQIEKIASEENVHICLLVQVGRKPEERKDKRPILSDLRECGNFEQDADLVLLLYREGYYDKDLNDDMLDVEIAKQRDGPSGVTYRFMIIDKQTLAIAPIGIKTLEDTHGQ
jgi:replicative DNA helicase